MDRWTLARVSHASEFLGNFVSCALGVRVRVHELIEILNSGE